METAGHHNSHLLPLRPADHRRPRNCPKNVRTTACEPMATRLRGATALKSQSVASVGSIIARRRSQNPSRTLCATGTRSPDPTVKEARDKGVGAAGEGEEARLPPPPERPLPGDCCGSGCARCVWDVYHEELQAYRDLMDDVKPAP